MLFTPVDAVPRGGRRGQVDAEAVQQGVAGRGEVVDVVAAAGGEPVGAGCRGVEGAVVPAEMPVPQERAHHGDAEAAGEVVVADPGVAQGAGAGAVAEGPGPAGGRQLRRRLQQGGNGRAGQPVVTVPAVPLDCEESRGGQPPQMAARRGGRHAGLGGEYGRCQGPTVEQGEQDAAAGGIGHGGADLGQVGVAGTGTGVPAV